MPERAKIQADQRIMGFHTSVMINRAVLEAGLSCLLIQTKSAHLRELELSRSMLRNTTRNITCAAAFCVGTYYLALEMEAQSKQLKILPLQATSLCEARRQGNSPSLVSAKNMTNPPVASSVPLLGQTSTRALVIRGAGIMHGRL